MMEAATLLETLGEYFANVPSASPPDASSNSLSLCDTVPLSDFQKQVLSLREIVPVPSHGATTDWLDNDWTTLVHPPLLHSQYHTQLAAIPKWHHSPGVTELREIMIFTDGSAATSSADIMPCSWAFTVWFQASEGLYFYGAAASQAAPPATPFHVGECDDTALTGEILALLWALVWAVEHAPQYQVNVTFYFDAEAVGRCIFGEWRQLHYPTVAGAVSLVQLAILLRQYLEQLTSVHYDHVKGHSGALGNEAADAVAKTARKSRVDFWDRCQPAWPAHLRMHPLAQWLWLLAHSGPDMPTLFAFESEADRFRANPSTPQCAPALGIRAELPCGAPVHYRLCCISFNTLTLKDKGQASTAHCVGMKVLGRKGMLQRELQSHRPFLVGLQETRLQESTQAPDADYLIYQASATEAGVGGCALWIARRIPYGTVQGRKLCVEDHHVVVTGYSSRHINVTIAAPHLRLFVMVAHCPSLATHPYKAVEAFWRDRAHELERRPRGYDYIVLVDANSQVGSIETPHVSGHQRAEENPAGSLLHDFLVSIDGFLPSTFEHIQTGPGDTWCSCTGDRHRIDFVVLPLSWFSHTINASVLTGLEALQLREDHSPVRVQVDFQHAESQAPYFDCKRRAVRPPPPASAEERSHQRGVLRALPTCPWYADVDEQYAFFVDAWSVAGRQLTPPKTTQPHQPFLTPHTLNIAQWCKALRKYLRAEATERRRRWLLVIFAAMRLHCLEKAFTAPAIHRADTWLRDMDISESTAVSILNRMVKQLRAGVARDRIAYLDDLVKQVASHSLKQPAALYKAIRRAFPAAKAARRGGSRPLPAVINDQGVFAATPHDKAECWRQHFAAQEVGIAVTAEEYVQRSSDTKVVAAAFEISSMPTLSAVEDIIIKLKAHKAAGPDNLTADLFRLCPQAAARSLLPIFTKTTLSLREPTEFRGGTLMCLAKRVGASLQCSHYRSILLSSIPAKVYHRHLRNLLVPLHAADKTVLQLGALGGIGVEAVALAARSFQLQQHSLRKPWGIIFVDVQAAFYRVVRQALTPHYEDDTGILHLLHRMGMPAQAANALCEQLHRLAILPDIGATEQVTALIQDIMRSTWFRIDTHDILTMTFCGTRPGDPAADLLFALAFGEFLKVLDNDLRHADLCPTAKPASPQHDWVAGPSTGLGAPAWADDFFLPQSAPAPSELLGRLQRTAECTVRRATSLGMRLTFANTKTAVLLPAATDWSQYPECQQNPQGDLYIPVSDTLANEQHEMPIVHSYRHLGGILTSSATPRPDLLLRQSQALGVVKPLRRKLFRNRDIPLHTRRTLLRALSVSRLVHSAASLILPAAIQQRLWDRAYVQVWRSLLPRAAADKQSHSLHVLRVSQAPSPPIALAKTRAAFLRQLTLNGPTALKQLMYQHWVCHPKSSWLNQLKADAALVQAFCPQVAPLFERRCPVTVILDSLLEDPEWWRRQVQLLQKAFLTDIEKALQQPQASIAVVSRPSREPGSANVFACPVCASGFPLRKHLYAHMARAHKLWSPARHFAYDSFCPSCHRWTGNVRLVQLHLKRHDECLRRACHLIPPMTTEQIREVEHEVVQRDRLLRKGKWESFRGHGGTAVLQGPRLPTADERLADLDFLSEQVTLDVFRPLYRPPVDVIDWIEDYLRGRSTEGPRQTATSYWHRGPLCTEFHQNSNNFGMRRE